MVFILFSDAIVLTTQHQFAINFGALLESNKLLVSPKGQEDLHKSMQWVLKIVSFFKKVTFSNGGGWEWRGEAPPVHPTGASLERSRREESWRKEKGKRGGELHISSPRFTPPSLFCMARGGGGGERGRRKVRVSQCQKVLKRRLNKIFPSWGTATISMYSSKVSTVWSIRVNFVPYREQEGGKE